MTVRHTLARAV